MGELIDRDAFADQRHHVAAPRRVGRQVGDVDRDQVHGDAAGYRAALAGDDDFRTAGAVAGAGGPEIAVGIAGRDNGKLRGSPRAPGAAVTDGVAALDGAGLDDARLEVDDRLHRIVRFRRRVDAVEGGPGAYQVEHEGRAEIDAGRIGQRRRHAGEEALDLAEGRELPGIDGAVELLGGDEVAHHQRDAVIAGIDARDQALRFRNRQAQPVHAGVDVDGSAPRPAGAAAEHVP